MATQIDPKELDMQEQLARIRKTQAEIDTMFDERSKLQSDIQRIIAETDQRHAEREKIIGETKYIGPAIILQAMIATGALLAAGATVAKVFFP